MHPAILPSAIPDPAIMPSGILCPFIMAELSPPIGAGEAPAPAIWPGIGLPDIIAHPGCAEVPAGAGVTGAAGGVVAAAG